MTDWAEGVVGGEWGRRGGCLAGGPARVGGLKYNTKRGGTIHTGPLQCDRRRKEMQHFFKQTDSNP